MAYYFFVVCKKGIYGILCLITVFPCVLKAYEVPTHADITKEGIRMYELLRKETFKKDEREKMIQGSRDEDLPPRYIHHFYDPIHNTGWLGNYIGSISPIPSIKWAFDSKTQSKTIYHGDFSWPPRDEKKNYETIGHIMHLLEDLTVPEHTRLDTHLPYFNLGSPYETYFSLIPLTQYVHPSDYVFHSLSLNNLFKEMALYSVTYFFSEDTITSPRFTTPKIISTRDETLNNDVKVKYALGKDDRDTLFRLALVLPQGTNKWRKLLSSRIYTVNDPLVMDDYARRLIPFALSGIMRALTYMAPQGEVLGTSTTTSWSMEELHIPRATTRTKKVTHKIAKKKTTKPHTKIATQYIVIPHVIESTPHETIQPAVLPTYSDPSPVILPTIPPLFSGYSSPAPLQDPVAVAPSPPITNDTPSLTPTTHIPEPVVPPAPTPPPSIIPIQETPPPAPIVTQKYVAINEIAWAGTQDSASNEWIELYNPSRDIISLEGWTLRASDGTPLIHLEGSIGPYSYYLLERTDDSTVPGITADQIYVGGLSNNGETLILTDAHQQIIDTVDGSGGWPAGDNGCKCTMQRIDPRTSGTHASNWSTSPTSSGTPKAPNSGSKLSNSSSLSVALPYSTPTSLLLHVSYDASLSSTSSPPLYHEIMYFTRLSTTTPCAIPTTDIAHVLSASTTGDSLSLISLSPFTAYCVALRSWTSLGPTELGTATTVYTLASPLSKESKKVGGDIYGGEVWTPKFNPYLVVSDLIIKPGAVVVIEPGVVVKFAGGRQIIAQGTLTAVGTPLNPIVFTSYADDTFAGDSNNDMASSSPQPGDWERIQMGGSFCTSVCGILAGPTTLDHTIIRYGGGLTSKSMLYNSGSMNMITNNDIGYGLDVGLLNLTSPASSSTTTIRFNTFHHLNTAIKNNAGALVDILDNLFHDTTTDIFP